jgi:hypothetical protein
MNSKEYTLEEISSLSQDELKKLIFSSIREEKKLVIKDNDGFDCDISFTKKKDTKIKCFWCSKKINKKECYTRPSRSYIGELDYSCPECYERDFKT